jgi:hypothetical protein
MRRQWRLKLEPRDIWVGLYWDRREHGVWLYICLIPCLVLIGEPKDPAA